MAGKQITNPGLSFGYTDMMTQLYSQTAEFITSTTVTGPVVVSIDTTGKIAASATNGTASLCVGVAVDSIASGSSGLVVVEGVAENCVASGAIAAGDVLKRSVTTAGAVSATATPGVGEAIGFAINASASATVDVWVCKAL